MRNLKRALTIQLVVFLRKIGIKAPPIPTVSCIISRNREGKILVLMIKLAYRNGYALPGGGIEHDETVEGALARECEEEIGSKPANLKYFGSSFANKEGLNMIHISFVGNLTKKTLGSSKEGVPEWLDINTAVAKCAYADQKNVLERYKQAAALKVKLTSKSPAGR